LPSPKPSKAPIVPSRSRPRSALALSIGRSSDQPIPTSTLRHMLFASRTEYLRRTPAPVKCDEIKRMPVNRRIAGSRTTRMARRSGVMIDDLRRSSLHPSTAVKKEPVNSDNAGESLACISSEFARLRHLSRMNRLNFTSITFALLGASFPCSTLGMGLLIRE
jgi:hypothetical protein